MEFMEMLMDLNFELTKEFLKVSRWKSTMSCLKCNVSRPQSYESSLCCYIPLDKKTTSITLSECVSSTHQEEACEWKHWDSSSGEKCPNLMVTRSKVDLESAATNEILIVRLNRNVYDPQTRTDKKSDRSVEWGPVQISGHNFTPFALIRHLGTNLSLLYTSLLSIPIHCFIIPAPLFHNPCL